MPVNLSAPGQNADYPQIAIAADGTATAVWKRYTGAGDAVQSATRPAGGSFGTPVNLSASGQSADHPQIAVSPDGTATAVWYAYNGVDTIIQAATRSPGGSFGEPVNLSASGQSAYFPQIATGSGGRATAVWYRYSGSHDVVQSASTKPMKCANATLKLTGIKLNRKKGTATITAKVGTAGKLTLKGSKNNKQAKKKAKQGRQLQAQDQAQRQGCEEAEEEGQVQAEGQSGLQPFKHLLDQVEVEESETGPQVGSAGSTPGLDRDRRSEASGRSRCRPPVGRRP